jgi:protein TonB
MFESSLIRPKKGSRRAAAALPLAVFFHLVILGSVAAASYWNVSEVLEPEMHFVFFSASAPPPPPPARGGVKPEQTEHAVAPVEPPTTPVQPDEVPEETPAATATSLLDLIPVEGQGDPYGDPHGDPQGVDGGVEHGVLHSDGKGEGGPGFGSDPRPASNEPIHFKAGMTPPQVVARVQPRYTEAARKAGVQGTVIVEAIIDEQGRVTNLRVTKSLPMGLDQAAVDAVRQWRFKPALLGTRPVKIFWALTVNFQLQR